MAVFDREHYFRDLLAKQVGGRIEVVLPFGRADVMTDSTVWEVEPASRYPAGVRQALQYASQTGLTAALATYGPGELAIKVFDHLAKLPAPGVELWWLYERSFTPVRTAGEAAGIADLATGEPPASNPPMLLCEVIDQDAGTGKTCSCDERPVMWNPMRLCQRHLDRILHAQPLIPPPFTPIGEGPDLSRRATAARDLKLAEDMVGAMERLASPHVDADSRALLAAYCIEMSAVLWHEALDTPDYAEVWNDRADEDD